MTEERIYNIENYRKGHNDASLIRKRQLTNELDEEGSLIPFKTPDKPLSGLGEAVSTIPFKTLDEPLIYEDALKLAYNSSNEYLEFIEILRDLGYETF